MTYKTQVYEKARDILRERRRAAEHSAADHLNRFHRICPQAQELNRQIQSTGSRAATAVIRGGNARAELEKLKRINLDFQREYGELLRQNKMQKSDLEPAYTCPKCRDTGFVDGFYCTCHKELLKKICYDELNCSSPLEVSGFESFSTSYFANYPADQKAIMEKIFEYCKTYARDFSERSPSLLFQGGTGLGKTHLSLSIAKTAIEKGFGVIYGSVHNFAAAIERERFSEPDDTSALISSCDLLILDDLGTEFNSSYTQSVIYNIINTRIMQRSPTIISTNLTGDELKKRYSERLVSRLFGAYNRLGFMGRDIRTVKKLKD